MAEYNLFDLVALAFDPPETSAKLVKKKIDQKIEELQKSYPRATQIVDKVSIQAKTEYLNNTLKSILSPDGKRIISSEFLPIASEKVAKEIEALKGTVALLALSGNLTVTAAIIKHYKNKTRLSLEHVKEVFTEACFTIIDNQEEVELPKTKFPVNVDLIHKQLETLKELSKQQPFEIDTSLFDNLYSFAAYISNDTSNVSSFRNMETLELCSIYEKASFRFSKHNDDLGTLCGTICSASKKNVFNSEENRKGYNLYLLYHSPELTNLFENMKRAPENILLEPRFAEPCINIISHYFPNQKIAVAIYNDEAGFTEKKYEPLSAVYLKKCSYCSHVNKFTDEKEAVKINACQNKGCGKPLFKKCEKCGRYIPVERDICPYEDCKYVFASSALFSKYFQQAETAFKRCDYELARQLLFKAQSVAPNEKTRIQNLSKKIDEEENKSRIPINTLKQLIADRKFQTARKELARIIREYPNLNVSEFERIISTELSKMDALFASANGYNTSKKADVCVSILMQCADYYQAISFLRKTPPLQVNTISVSPSPRAGVININWSISSEQNVSYKLVRKTGVLPSISEDDGIALLENTNKTSFVDRNVTPGQIYTYSVYAVRMSVVSKATSRSGVVYSEVQNCHVNQTNNTIRITWDAPANSMGATIKRTNQRESKIVAESAHGSFEDVSIEIGQTYVYKICANYSDGKLSSGVECVITPLLIIDSFSFRINQIKDNRYKINWDIKQKGIALRILVNGKLNVETKSDSMFTQIILPKDTYCSVSVLAFSGGQWISSKNTEEVNTYTSCPIDKKSTEYEEKMMSGRNGVQYQATFKIKLSERIPQNVVGFYYAIRSTKSSNRWASQSEIGSSSDIQRISINEYNRLNAISFQDYVSNETTFFISVFTIYDVGKKEIVSLPSKLKVNRPLLANLFWRVSYSRFDGLKLSIELSGNKPIEYIPALILCASEGDRFIAAPDDKNAIVLSKKSSMELEIPEGIVQKNFIIPTELPPKYIKKCKFFLFENELAEDDKIMLRWKQGFSGKV